MKIILACADIKNSEKTDLCYPYINTNDYDLLWLFDYSLYYPSSLSGDFRNDHNEWFFCEWLQKQKPQSHIHVAVEDKKYNY